MTANPTSTCRRLRSTRHLSSFGIVVAGFGMVYLPWGWISVGVGLAITLWGLFGWSLEPVTKEH